MFVEVSKKSLHGSVLVPGSKSHTIRAVLLSALADGTTEIMNPLPSFDCLSAAEVAKALGAEVEIKEDRWIVKGTAGNPKVPENVVDTGNSGTATYFAMGIAGAMDGITVITGDEQIRRRPVAELVNGLRELGVRAEMTTSERKAPPVIIKGPMQSGVVHMSGFSSQFTSAILLAAAMAEGKIEILIENPLEKPYLQMTVDWVRKFGGEITMSSDYKHFIVQGRKEYKSCPAIVPADWSGAAFPLIAAVITDSTVVIEGVDVDDCQGDKEVLQILLEMGADIEVDKDNMQITVRGGKPLKAKEVIDLSDIPDTLPALSVCACFAQGDTHFTGLAHVRVKETDRVAVMHELLTKCGADIEIGADDMIVHGGKPLTGCEVDSYDDHRIAMAMTVCGLAANGTMKVKHAECASVSFPEFYDKMNKMGAGIKSYD